MPYVANRRLDFFQLAFMILLEKVSLVEIAPFMGASNKPHRPGISGHIAERDPSSQQLATGFPAIPILPVRGDVVLLMTLAPSRFYSVG